MSCSAPPSRFLPRWMALNKCFIIIIIIIHREYNHIRSQLYHNKTYTELLFSYYICSFILSFTLIRSFKSVVVYISLHYCIRKSSISIITATIIARESYLCLCNGHSCCNIIMCTLVLHSDRFNGFDQNEATRYVGQKLPQSCNGTMAAVLFHIDIL